MPIEYRALLVLGFMILGFLLDKWPKGLTAMTCCFLFFATGVTNLQKSFSGLTNTTIFTACGLLTVIYALQKTTLMVKMKGLVGKLNDKSGLILLLGFLGLCVIFSQFLGTGACVPILLSFLCTLPEDKGDITVSRLAIPVAGLCAMWQYTFPIGSSLGLPLKLNAFYAEMATDPSMLVGLGDLMKMKLIPCLLVTVWTVFGYKLMPKTQANIAAVATKKKDKAEAKPMTKWQEYLVYACMLGIMIGLLLGTKIGEWQYAIPVLSILLLAFTKTLTVPEVIKQITNDTIWMLVGIMTMSSVLSSSGAGALLGNTIVGWLGENPSPIVALIIFAGAAGIMTNLMSNLASRAVVAPIAAVTAISAGWNPVPFVMAVHQMAWCAVILPSASSASALAFATANQELKDSLKYSIPFYVLGLIGCIASMKLFY